LLLGDLFALLDLPASPMTPGQESYAAHGDPLVEFQAVGFQYPNMTTPILTDLSFAIYPGQTVALVGENGAGKSTLAKLMLGLYVPTTGQIVRTQPRGESGSATMDAAASAVFQGYVSYQTTAAENIGFGDTTTLGDRERLERAAARAGADSVIHALPRGLETPLGRLVEGAVDLSGGQWQKLALARGAVRTARLLVLDEPTSASDPLSELEILTTFQKLADGQATLLVSHRLGAARMASHILVLEQGRLVEQGTHAQLVAKGGTYARLWETQARWYQEQSFDVLAGD
jgi:ATP-binding cassette subfamily B protein